MTRKTFYISSALLFTVVSSGCAVYTPAADFTKQRYTNVVSYFNTFYNAQRLFNDAEDEVVKAKREFLDRPGANKSFSIPATARQKFQTSIEKNSKVLSFYADSKWVDDALMMIGKAYYYMEDDVRAERKFLEMAVQFPSSDLIPESQLWLGMSLLRQKKTKQGVAQLEEVVIKRNSGGDDGLAGFAANELGQYYFNQQDYPQAEKYYSLAAGLVEDRELETQIYFQVGKCYSELKQFDNAIIAFAKAADASPLYALRFQALLQQIKATAHQNNYEEALSALYDMLRDTKNTEYYGVIHFEIANILMLQGNVSKAIEKYRYVDTTFVRTEESARSYYVLGKYYETVEQNYDSARTMYTKARLEFTNSDITNDAAIKADIFTKYAELRKELLRSDSLYLYELYKSDPIDTMQAALKDSVVKKDSLLQKENNKQNKTFKTAKQEIKKDTVVTIDSSNVKDRMMREQAKSVMLDSLKRSIAQTKFELGGLFYLEIQQPDSALYWFTSVFKNHPNTPVAPRALYTIAEIYRTVKPQSKTERDTIYQSIIKNYSDSPYANEARKNLGIPVIIVEKDPAIELFEKAEQLAESKKYEPAIDSYKKIANQYPASPMSAKALFSAGWHYENSVLKNDSAYNVYKRVISLYPVSPYVSVARAKVYEYENEMQRIEQEKQKEIQEQKLKIQQEQEAKLLKEKQQNPAPADSLSTPKN